ncbi:hypothetical protein [Burkholderia cepacia]|uniref:hypothetical protein n=1 Tax=Burkholderia cepacia TaxID=292 RepID=UPI001E44713A|nr:hypothetical protein [Burkholderia cepacia]
MASCVCCPSIRPHAAERNRRATASGRDIYAVSAPIIVEAAVRLMTGHTVVSGGVRSLGELFDARDFLAALDSVAVSFGTTTDPVFHKETQT